MNLKKTNLFAALGLASGAAFAQEAAETVPVDVTEAAREAGNQFWHKEGWKLREDLNTYDFVLNEENITNFNA